MKIIVWIILLATSFLTAYGQEIKPEIDLLIPLKMDNEGDHTAQAYNNDQQLNSYDPGYACIKITLSDSDRDILRQCKFECKGYGGSRDSLGQVWLFILAGVKELTVHHNNYDSHTFSFGTTLEKGKVYTTELSLRYRYGSIAIETSQDSVRVRLNGVLNTAVAGKKQIVLNNTRIGKYEIKLSKNGFEDYIDTLLVEENKVTHVTQAILQEIVHYGSLYIESDPAGAEIFIDDISQEKLTTVTLPNVKTGKHWIELRKKGYKNVKIEYDVKEGITNKPNLFYLKEIERSGEVIITCKDRETGKEIPSPLILAKGKEKWNPKNSVKAGLYPITIAAINYEPKHDTVEVVEGKTKNYEFYLEKAKDYGTLKITTIPDQATIKVDEKTFTEVTPQELRLPVGKYNLIISKPGYKSKEETIRISKNDQTIVNKRLKSSHSKYARPFWIEYTYSPTTYAGVTIGAGGRVGGYLRAKGFQFDFGEGKGYKNLASLETINRLELTRKGYIRDSYTAGIDCGITRWLYPYVGAGYGGYSVWWQDSQGNDFASAHIKGLEIEAGVRLRFNWFQISAGGTFMTKKTPVNGDLLCDYNLGMGFCF